MEFTPTWQEVPVTISFVSLPGNARFVEFLQAINALPVSIPRGSCVHACHGKA